MFVSTKIVFIDSFGSFELMLMSPEYSPDSCRVSIVAVKVCDSSGCRLIGKEIPEILMPGEEAIEKRSNQAFPQLVMVKFDSRILPLACFPKFQRYGASTMLGACIVNVPELLSPVNTPSVAITFIL